MSADLSFGLPDKNESEGTYSCEIRNHGKHIGVLYRIHQPDLVCFEAFGDADADNTVIPEFEYYVIRLINGSVVSSTNQFALLERVKEHIDETKLRAGPYEFDPTWPESN